MGEGSPGTEGWSRGGRQAGAQRVVMVGVGGAGLGAESLPWGRAGRRGTTLTVSSDFGTWVPSSLLSRPSAPEAQRSRGPAPGQEPTCAVRPRVLPRAPALVCPKSAWLSLVFPTRKRLLLLRIFLYCSTVLFIL